MGSLQPNQRAAFEEELEDLKLRQHEAVKKAVFLRMSREEVEEFEKRRDRIHKLLYLLERLTAA